MSEERLPTIEEALEEVRTKPLVDIWPTACVLLDCSKGTGYALAQRGEIDVLGVGRLKKVVSSSLRRKLGIDSGAA